MVVQASINVVNDQDYYAITTFAGRTITVMATGDPERDGSSTDLRLTLFGSNGTTVLLTAEGTNAGGPDLPFAESFCYTVPANGTYFIRVNESGNDSSGTYRLFVAAPAQTKRWTGASGPNWGSALNWDPALLHPGDALVFPSNASFLGSTNNLTAGTAFDAITFTAESANNGNYGLDGNRVVLSNGVTNNTASPQTLTLPIDLASDQTFQNTQAAGTMLFTGQIQTGTRTLTVTGPGSMTINDLAATLAAPGTAALIKNGLGELALPSAVNVNGRALQLNGGTMTVNAITPSTPVTISGGTLGGAGTVGNVTASGGAITPGNSAGVLNTGNLSLNSSTSIAFELNGPTVGTQYDQINVTGLVTLNNAGFGPVFNFVPPVGTAFITSPTGNPTTTGTSPFLTIGGTTASADVADGGPALSKVEGSDVNGPRAGAVTSVTCASNRGFSGTATGTTTWQCDVPLQPGVNVISVSASDAGGQSGTDIISVTVTNFVYYLAEGATGPFFDLELALANPTATAAPVNILFLKGDGTTVPVNLTVPPQSRASVLVDDLPGLAETAVSAIVTSVDAIALAVERTMRWNTQGYGSHTEKATAGAHTTWLFAEGSEQAIFDTYLLLANPQPTANRATVTFLVENGAPVVKSYDLLPTSRTNVFAEGIPELKEKSFGMAVSFDQPGVAERAMYFGTSVFWDGGHESAGVNEASTSWFHAEGATGPFFDTFILLSNPNAAPATVTLTFLLDTGETVVKTKVVPANARLTVIVEGEDAKLANAAMATQVTSTLPIVSERAMYWAQYPNWYEAHNSFGVTSTGTKWALGEGRVGGAFGFETYILLANPGATAANVTVTFLREAGLAPITRTYDVNATSRFNVYANAADIGLTSGERYGVLIVSSVPIAVERAMYSNSPLQPGVVWAAGTNASATKIP